MQLLSRFPMYRNTHTHTHLATFTRTELFRSTVWLRAGIVTLSSSVARGTPLSCGTSDIGAYYPVARDNRYIQQTRTYKKDMLPPSSNKSWAVSDLKPYSDLQQSYVQFTTTRMCSFYLGFQCIQTHTNQATFRVPSFFVPFNEYSQEMQRWVPV